VESDTGTGLVMSVPAHAPFDYQALVDFKKDQPLGSEYQLIKPISIISTEGYGDFSAKEACEKFEIKNQDDPKLEEATDEIYGKEFYGGVLKDNCEQFAGKKVSEAKDVIKEWLESNKYSDILLELTNAPVKCRCGTECVVKVLTNQWFLNYGDKDWKAKATKCFDGMNVLPNEIVDEFHYVIGWLHERACARQHGLGTKLPWDKDWIVESLSDSVIYMSYYTISRFVNDGTIQAENLSKEFFDCIFNFRYFFAGKLLTVFFENSSVELFSINLICGFF
jgi:leucyl-tRNA synthetase